MKIYNYDSVNKTFISESQADYNPRTKEYSLVPAFATTIAPPNTGVNEIATFNGSGWDIVDDVRGYVWVKETGEQIEYTELGQLPETLTDIPKPEGLYVWDNGTWIIDNNAVLEEAKQVLNNQLLIDRYAPISYDGKVLDADKTAIENINGKIVEIEGRLKLNITMDANQMFWRDANNNVHAFNDMNVYLDWLRGLAVAISERTTQLYMTKWESEAQL